jgi:hypothetical protein
MKAPCVVQHYAVPFQVDAAAEALHTEAGKQGHERKLLTIVI